MAEVLLSARGVRRGLRRKPGTSLWRPPKRSRQRDSSIPPLPETRSTLPRFLRSPRTYHYMTLLPTRVKWQGLNVACADLKGWRNLPSLNSALRPRFIRIYHKYSSHSTCTCTWVRAHDCLGIEYTQMELITNLLLVLKRKEHFEKWYQNEVTERESFLVFNIFYR